MSARILSLCSGYLGLDMAVESVLDARTVAVSDIDPGAKRILTHRAPDVPNLGDVKTIHWEDWAGVEIMTAGYPCQPFSHAGKRGGVDDPRHIFPFIADGIRRVGPRLVFLENVRGHLRLGFDVVLGALADIGYDAQWVCVRASDVGACHKRERLFIVATPADSERGGWDWRAHEPVGRSQGRTAAAGSGEDARGGLTLLPTPAVNDMGAGKTVEEWDAWTARMKSEHGNGNGHGPSLSIEALRLLKTPTAQLAVNGGSQHPDKRKGGGHGPLADEIEHLLPTPRASRGGSGTETMYAFGAERSDDNRPQGEVLLPTPRATDGTKGGPNQRGSSGDLMLPSAVQKFLPTPLTTDWNTAASRWDADRKTQLRDFGAGTQDWSVYESAIRRHEAALGRPAPSPTETGPKGGQRLSPKFVEWMMMLPDGHVTDPAIGLSRNEQLKALGNGVVPPQAAAALRFMLARQGVAA